MGVSINGGTSGTPIAGWMIKENPIKMNDLGVSQIDKLEIWKVHSKVCTMYDILETLFFLSFLATLMDHRSGMFGEKLGR